MRELIRLSRNEIYYGGIDENSKHYDGIGLKREEHGEIYYGSWENGARSGWGVFCNSEGRIRVGEWLDDVARGEDITIDFLGDPFVFFKGVFSQGNPCDGIGITSDGRAYYGKWTEWRNNEFDGEGVFTWTDGRIYAGKWKNGHQDIGGMIRRIDGRVSGTWKSDNEDTKTFSWKGDSDRIFFYGKTLDESIRNADGIIVYANNCFYAGTVKNGLRSDTGVFKDSAGTVYIGEWRNNYRDGKGILYTSGETPTLFIGDFHKDCIEGQGILFSVDIHPKDIEHPSFQIKYCGDWKENLHEGLGIFDAGNDLIYYGEFSAGYRHGEGEMISPEGERCKCKPEVIDENHKQSDDNNISTMENDDENKQELEDKVKKIYYENGGLMYEGETKNGLWEGYGCYYNRDGELVYQGEFKENKYNGQGKAFNENGAYYEGDFVNNKFEGKGKSFYPDGKRKYEGDYLNGTWTGFGCFYSQNGELLYEGEWKNNEYNGKGKSFYPDGKRKYEGDYLNGTWTGFGCFYSQNGELLYEGEWKNNEYNGKGKSFYPNGNIRYEGDYLDGKCTGVGTYYNEEGNLVYKGELNENQFDGKGTSFYPDGSIQYEGDFACNMYQGKGRLYYLNSNTYYEGDFVGSKRDGKGTIYTLDGKIVYNGYFSNDLECAPSGQSGEKYNPVVSKVEVKTINESAIEQHMTKQEYSQAFSDGSKFSGKQDVDNTRKFNGKIMYDDGSIYEGNLKVVNVQDSIKDGILKPHGLGKILIKNSHISETIEYDGFWKDGKMNGTSGILRITNPVMREIKKFMYKGDFRDGCINNYGILEIYRMNLSKNHVMTEAEFQKANLKLERQSFQGEWSRGKFKKKRFEEKLSKEIEEYLIECTEYIVRFVAAHSEQERIVL